MPPELPEPPSYFLTKLLALQHHVRQAVSAGRRPGVEAAASEVVREGAVEGEHTVDTIYRIDVRSEATLLEFCAEWARERERPFVLVAEGLPGAGRQVFPTTADPADATFECIVDPIDGTRLLMYDKRSAWVLAAVAPGQAILGRPPTMHDLAVAVQTELPTSRARLADTLWAVSGGGAAGETLDLTTGVTTPVRFAPSRAPTLAHGFATISKFFPGTREAVAWLEERLFAEVVGEHAGGAPLVFDDQYVSSGGQLYELMMGHDRFTADLRPVLMPITALPGSDGSPARPVAGVSGASGRRRLCARPYDLCTALIAREAGVHVTDEWGQPLAAPLDAVADVSWVGYANEGLRRTVEPVLQRLLRDLGVTPPPESRVASRE
jgi:hypothetical protein